MILLDSVAFYLQISNATNPELIKFSPIDSNVLVQIGLVSVTALLVYVTWRKMSESNRQTKESNEMMKIELKSRLKPVFHVVNFSPEPQNEANPQTMIYRPQLQNKGPIPARNIHIYYSQKAGLITLVEIIRNEREIKKRRYDHRGILQENYFIKEFETELKKWDNEFSVALWIEYEFLDGIKEESIMVLIFKENTVYAMDTYSYSEIVEARNNLKNEHTGL